MDNATRFLGLMAFCTAVCIVLFGVYPHATAPYFNQISHSRQLLVQSLGLTDLCLFTEARYTRHLSQADLHSAFQAHPLALEHFPSGAIVLPPTTWRRPASDPPRTTH